LSTSDRRYDIDWLRVIAIVMLLIYHVVIVFQPWGKYIGFIQSEETSAAVWIPMALLNVWRIPLLFFVSGMGVCFALRRRDWKQLLAERARRILLPLVFGTFFIVPIHVFIFQKYYGQEIVYSPNEGHLWFLLNICIYVIQIIGFAFLDKNYDYKFFNFGDAFWNAVDKIKITSLIIAFVLYLVRLFYFELNAPNFLTSIESMNWIFAIFGFAYKYLNKPGKVLSYLSQAVYPVYIIHMIFLFWGSYIILPLNFPLEINLILIILFTFGGSYITYELVIKRIGFIKPFFGLKGKR